MAFQHGEMCGVCTRTPRLTEDVHKRIELACGLGDWRIHEYDCI
jgi:hypothetical protein